MKARIKKLVSFWKRHPWIVAAGAAIVGAAFGWLLFAALWNHIVPRWFVVPSVAIVDIIFTASAGILLASVYNGFQDLFKEETNG
jgi:hypothetical protein